MLYAVPLAGGSPTHRVPRSPENRTIAAKNRRGAALLTASSRYHVTERAPQAGKPSRPNRSAKPNLHHTHRSRPRSKARVQPAPAYRSLEQPGYYCRSRGGDMISRLSTVAVALTLATVGPLQAAPFCAVLPSGQQCIYYSLDACNNAVRGTGSSCRANPQELRAPTGSAPFCVLSAAGTNCLYYDSDSCWTAARPIGGACVKR